MTISTLGIIRQYAAGTSAALSVFIAGCWLGWPSPAVKMLLKNEAHIQIDVQDVSWIVALMDFGNVLSPVPSGYLSDFFGRKITLIGTAFLFLGTWLLAIFGSLPIYLFAARIGAGIGKGVAFTVVPMYLGEIAGVQVRGAVSTIFTGLLYSGILFEYCIGPFLSYRMLNIVSGIIPFVFFLTYIVMPESPYYLLMRGRQKEARRSLVWFRNAHKTDEALERELDEMAKNVQREMEEKGSFLDLVKTVGNRKALLIVMVLSSFQRLSGVSPLLAYTTVTLPATGGGVQRDLYMIIFGVTMVIGNFLGTPLIDKLGRKPLLLASCLGCAVVTGISGVFYYWVYPYKPDELITPYNWVPYACFVTFGITYSLGIGVIPSTFVAELFPTNVKSFASAISAIFFALASFLINKIYLLVAESVGVHYMFLLFTMSSIFSTLFTYFLVFETKGKTFTEIQNKLNNRRQQETLIMNDTQSGIETTEKSVKSPDGIA